MTMPANTTYADVGRIVQAKGRRCIKRIAPLATVAPTEHRQTRAGGHSIEYPSCGKTFAAGAIVTSAPEFVTDYRLAHYTGYMVTRRLFCDHEDLIIKWDQACDGNGNLAAEIGTYSIERGRAAVEKFLRDHPAAAGVAQVAQ